jgi:hypothetical protein
MSNYERSIVSLIEPDFKGKIKLDVLLSEDFESKEAKDKQSNAVQTPANVKDTSRIGAFVPSIYINAQNFKEDEMQYMTMDCMDKIPTISVTLKDHDNKFSISAPIDGDVLSLYLRPPDADNQKPIRIDFNITSISSDITQRLYFIAGSMKIPEFYREVGKSYPAGTSFDHLQTVCEETGLGFATNEDSTDDLQPRICAWDTYETFVNDTVFSSYKDDESFFDWYIDPYYYLCFVNVNKQFSLEDKTEEVNISSSMPLDAVEGNQNAKNANSIKGSLVLTNDTKFAEKNVYINRYTINNAAARVWLNNGYKRYGQWANLSGSEFEFQEAFVDPLTTPGAETDYILLKGRKDDGEWYKTMNKYKWLGKQAPYSDDGNVHDNYCFSKVLNHQNLVELEKTTLVVELAGMNFYIYKYMRIPVNIYESGNPKNQILMKNRNESLGISNKNSDDALNSVVGKLAAFAQNPPGGANEVTDEDGPPEQTQQTKNEFLSGYYIVTGIKYKYDPYEKPMKMELTLTRREWPIPAKLKDV